MHYLKDNHLSMQAGFFKRIWTQPPVAFPWVGVFHLFALIHALWIFLGDGFHPETWLYPLGLLIYTVAWIFICDLRKWAAYLYIGFTCLTLLLRITVRPFSIWADLSNVLFPANLIFCVLILIFFKRLK